LLKTTGVPGIDYQYQIDYIKMTIPYEFFPLPKEGEWVKGLNRCGEEIEKVQVLSIIKENPHDKTFLVSIAVPKNQFKEIRSIKVGDSYDK
jgi:hypothetical protein